MELLNALIKMQNDAENNSHGYHFQRASEGYNGVVYRATDENDVAYAVKIARQTKRKRGWREYTVTKAIHDSGIDDICPQPLHYFPDVEALNGDVIISTWIEGDLLVMPPASEDRDSWQSILRTLQKVHNLTEDSLSSNVPMSAKPVNHPDDMLSVIRTRFADTREDACGDLRYQQIKALVDALHKQIPKKWKQAVPLRLVHGDCHSANMIRQDDKIVLVDWENSGFSDPAFDVSNLTTSWRFFDLPETHHQWMVNTYAEMIDDEWLIKRVSVYSTIQLVHWVVTYTRFIQQRKTEDAQTLARRRFPPEFELKWQKKYYERACERLQLI